MGNRAEQVEAALDLMLAIPADEIDHESLLEARTVAIASGATDDEVLEAGDLYRRQLRYQAEIAAAERLGEVRPDEVQWVADTLLEMDRVESELGDMREFIFSFALFRGTAVAELHQGIELWGQLRAQGEV